MRPSRRFLLSLLVLTACAVAMGVLRIYWGTDSGVVGTLVDGWWLAFAVFMILGTVDGFLLRGKNPLHVERIVTGSFAVGVGNRVTLQIENTSSRQLRATVSDHYPDQIQVETGMPARVDIAANTMAEIKYWAHPTERGDALFADVDCRIESPLGLWEWRRRYALPEKVNVYPNFTAIEHFEKLGQGQQINQLGIHLMQRRGQGMDFHQLREYREGDTSRQIDWKASSRVQKIISREYQDERDQDIVFLLDCGRRMRTKDDELSHFDHCLNSLLLTSYVALRQGDAVGLMSFAGDSRWLSPIKGQTAINIILNSVYNLHSSTDTSDMMEAATNLMARHRKRALVILLTNLREEDREDVVAATQLLSRKHLVMVASMREQFLDDVIDNPVRDFESSLIYSQTTEILAMRRRLLETLRTQGVVIADSIPQTLHIQLVNEYWALKRSGRI